MRKPSILIWRRMATPLSRNIRKRSVVSLPLILPLLLPLTARAAVTFRAPVDYPVGSASQHVIAARLNTDKFPDLVVCNTSSDSISVLMNDGRGGFTKQDYKLADNAKPVRSAAGDFNGDTFTDVAVLHASGGVVSVFLSTAVPGVLSPIPTKITAGSMPTGIAAGKIVTGSLAPTDILLANQDTSKVAVLRNSGQGSFSSTAAYLTGTMPQSIAVADFNGDGIQDAVTGNVAKKNVSVLLGQGDRTFGAAKHSAATHTPGLNLVPCLLSGDSKMDLVAGDYSSGGAIVLRGNGDGTFQAPLLLPASGGQSYAIGVGDLNRDGLNDLVTVNFGSGDISVYIDDAAGGFEPAINFPVTPSASSYANFVAVEDFNQDGLADVAVTLSTGQVRVLTNTSVFVSGVAAAKASFAAGTAVTGTVTLTGAAPEGGALISLTTNPALDPAVSVPPTVTVPQGATSVSFDIVGRHVGTATVRADFNGLHQETTLTVTQATTTPPPGLNGDLDGDGRLTMNDVVLLLRTVGGESMAGS